MFQPGQGIVAPTEDDSWALFANAWQSLWLAEPHEARIDLANGEPDARGAGARFRGSEKVGSARPTN